MRRRCSDAAKKGLPDSQQLLGSPQLPRATPPPPPPRPAASCVEAMPYASIPRNERRAMELEIVNVSSVEHFRPSGDLARWSWLCYVLQEDGTSIPTLQESVKTVLVRPRSGRRPQVYEEDPAREDAQEQPRQAHRQQQDPHRPLPPRAGRAERIRETRRPFCAGDDTGGPADARASRIYTYAGELLEKRKKEPRSSRPGDRLAQLEKRLQARRPGRVLATSFEKTTWPRLSRGRHFKRRRTSSASRRRSA